MELKFLKSMLLLLHVLVLIVPLWNWNSELKDWSDALKGFNCTFMELKLSRVHGQDEGLRVLIVPLWNWNAARARWTWAEGGFNCTFMELK